MARIGRFSLALFFPFLLCFVAPSSGLQCVLRSENVGRATGVYGPTDAEEELKKGYGSLEKFKAMDMSKMPDFIIMQKTAALFYNYKAYNYTCESEEKCCFDYSFTPRHGKYSSIYGCSSICDVEGDSSYHICDKDFCNTGGYREKLEPFTDEVKASILKESINEVFKYVHEDIKKYLEEAEKSPQTSTEKAKEAAAAGATTNGDETSGYCRLLIVFTISYFFM